MKSEDLKGHHHGRHAGREDLTGEHSLGDTIQLILLFLFLAVWILDSFVFHYSTFLEERIPGAVRWTVGIILLLSAAYLSMAGLRVIFGEIRERPQVVTKGVFSLVRHPIYLGSVLTYGGLICITLSLFSAGLWVGITAFYWYISRHEEKLLIRRFGDEYRDYKRRVPMLFPIKLFRQA